MTYTDDAQPGKRLSRRMMLKAGLGVAATGALAALLAACGNTATATPAGGTSGGTSATKPAATAATGGGAPTATVSGALPTQPATPKPPKNASAMKIEWWHAMGGTNGKIVTDLCDQFNDSQSDTYVQPIYQGSYDDTINKFKAALPAKTVPHIIQVYDIGQRFMIDSKATDPMQSFVDADKFDLSQYEPAILNYYTVDKKLNAMPFNTSNPILYFNKKAFTDAGLDPEKPPKTWEDIEAAATKLVKKDSGGKVTQYGMAIAIYGWFFEQWLATQNAVYADPDNGRGANRATKVVYNSDAGTKVLDWWKGLIDKGVATNLGRNTSDTQKAFGSGQLPITVHQPFHVAQQSGHVLFVQGTGPVLLASELRATHTSNHVLRPRFTQRRTLFIVEVAKPLRSPGCVSIGTRGRVARHLNTSAPVSVEPRGYSRTPTRRSRLWIADGARWCSLPWWVSWPSPVQRPRSRARRRLPAARRSTVDYLLPSWVSRSPTKTGAGSRSGTITARPWY